MSVNRGETVALVGESGSGKSVSALSILQLLPKQSAKITGGEILFSKTEDSTVDLLKESFQTIRSIRGNQIGMIFQEPMTSLNPVFTCGNQVAESIKLHQKLSAREARTRTIEWFARVKLPDPENMYSRFPHELSGGQKQRVMIAMAMSCKPSLLICDEPTTALDVTVQKNILELIGDLKKEEEIGVIFITHDLGIVAEIADRVMVMFKGRIVESSTT
jgi:peptide/nickel transport system ATP-binding protein